MKRLFVGIMSLLVVASAAALPRVSSALTMVPLNLANLMDAELVFRGTCTAADAHFMKLPGSNMQSPVTTYTFPVQPDGKLKGDVPDTVTFTQYGVSPADAKKLGTASIQGIPYYDVGKEYVLFLTRGDSGLAATKGLGQGRFTVTLTPEGKAQVVNDYGNKNLFNGVPASSSLSKALSTTGVAPGTKGPIDYDAFVKLLQTK